MGNKQTGILLSPNHVKKNTNLRRNPHRSRLGGVCAGLSDFSGIPLVAIRLLFLFSLLFGGMGFWIYMILWITVPARQPLPFPSVSMGVRWHYFRLNRILAKIHRTQDPDFADALQDLFERAKLIAPRLDFSSAGAEDVAIHRLLKQDLPRLFEQIAQLPSSDPDGRRRLKTNQLRQELEDLSERIDATLRSDLDEACLSLVPENHASPQSTEFEQQIASLRTRLSRASGKSVSSLSAIEKKLHLLLDPARKRAMEHQGIRTQEIDSIAFEYLPQTLNAYLRALEGSECFRTKGQDPELDLHLEDQLALLDRVLGEYLKSLYREDTRSLRIQGRFLHDKFEGPCSFKDPNSGKIPS